MSNIIHHKDLVKEIDAFLAETGMGVSYFGKAAVGNSEVVHRLRSGREILPSTEAKIRAFLAQRLEKAS